MRPPHGRSRRAVRFADGERLAFRQDAHGVTVVLGRRPQGPDCIVELTVGR